jgi:acetylornithine/succinyldiaminopimelate/putrescine aminotransferase
MNDRHLFYRHLAQTSSAPLALEIERARGVYMYDKQGKAYLDLISGISVSALGHGHPHVLGAIREQLNRYAHLMVYGEFVQSPQVRLAALLTGCLPAGLDNVYLVNSGSEAVEGAMKLSKRHTGRTEIVGFRGAYHGSTQGALSIGGHEGLKSAFRPLLPDVRLLDYGEEGQLGQISERTACVVAESIQGEAGVVVPSVSFMQALRRRCDETGTLLVLDEIQTGFGRTGRLWAFEHFGIVPDVLCLAKGMGGGLPLGAFVAPREIMRSLTHDPVLGHISTFGGNAVCAAAAHAMLEVLIREKLWEQVPAREARFRELLKHPTVKSLRGKGLLLALELEDGQVNRKVIRKCLERGLLTDWFLYADHCLRIAPPLTIRMEEIDRACRILAEVLDEF